MVVEDSNQDQYVVLARKYRPQTFEDLLGQDALVQTLTNAIKNNRLHHAYILTGIRGVGKTTTARLIARALNCTGLDGQSGPTIRPCGACENCQAIASGRHIDVLELDAASRTGVDDIRELLDGVRYKPTNARYKVYIIDEVHMLSKGAFNALLKTLEEPPAHVKFIFATTEIRKVPVTILSRCQRFDLQRLNIATLRTLFNKIISSENLPAEDEALEIIARAADGSARDGLSLLDQAIVLGDGKVKTQTVIEMIGLADRNQTLNLFHRLVHGDMQGVLNNLQEQYKNGANPLIILQDLIDVTHMLAKAKLVPSSITTETLGENERNLCAELSGSIPIAVLSRMWQMMIKGINELNFAPMPLDALEMILIRIAYSASLPTPIEMLNDIKKNSESALIKSCEKTVYIPQSSPIPCTNNSLTNSTPLNDTRAKPVSEISPAQRISVKGAETEHTQSQSQATNEVTQSLQDYSNQPSVFSVPEAANFDGPFSKVEEFVSYLQENKKMLLLYELKNDVSIEEFGNRRIKLALSDKIQPDFMQNLQKALLEATGQKWQIEIQRGPVGETLAAKEKANLERNKQSVMEYPLVKAILNEFKGARIDTVTRKTDLPDSATDIETEEALPPLMDDEE